MSDNRLENDPGLDTAACRARHLLGGRTTIGGGHSEALELVAGRRSGPPDHGDVMSIKARLMAASRVGGGHGLADEEANGLASHLVDTARRTMEAFEGGASSGMVGAEDALALEAVIQTRGRPAVRVVGDGLDPDGFIPPEDDRWRQIADSHRRMLLDIAGTVAAVRVRDAYNPSFTWVQGTAWMLADGLAVTNRHVLFPPPGGTALARRVYGSSSARVRRDYFVELDFAFDNGPARQHVCKVIDVPWVAAEVDPVDAAILRVELLQGPTTGRLELAQGDGGDLGSLFVVGHPGRMPEIPERVRLVFGDPDERKRVSFGEAMNDPGARPGEIVHDASTIGGYSGGGVFSFLNRSVEALHYWGSVTAGNRAITAAALRAHPEFNRFL
ncbi:trypsin-like peptidase domain-containing protein [Asticcacaulis sp.]|uniref:trypsin-like serine peptidase n=1 Tax=Asticcacaulis sp. TaxID=1872648 RepID=UPI002619627E|nr:trypsin-like peptidase domain-containing protein [Asticcacaulis sp.]